jgi:hypothetical protein
MPSMATPRRRTESASSGGSTRAYRGEQLTLRNHDHRSGYGLDVRVTDDTGTTVARERYVVGSQTTKRAFDLCPPGEYTIEVSHGGERADAVTCRLGESAADTVVVECGNGVVSVAVGPL